MVTYKGTAIPLSPSEVIILRELARSDTIVRTDDLLNACNSNGFSNVTATLVGRIRRKLEAFGAPDPILSESGQHGYLWGLQRSTQVISHLPSA